MFNGASATNQANYEQVKSEKPVGRKVAWSHGKRCFETRRAVLHKELSPCKETCKASHWEDIILNQLKQPGAKPCQ